MAQKLAELEIAPDPDQAGDLGKCVLRRCRGRPRLTDSDRAQRRLESRKKYDVRRVYLGESHKLWSELRRRTSLSDAGLAEYLILLNSTYGEKYQEKYCGSVKTMSSLFLTIYSHITIIMSLAIPSPSAPPSTCVLFALTCVYIAGRRLFLTSQWNKTKVSDAFDRWRYLLSGVIAGTIRLFFDSRSTIVG